MSRLGMRKGRRKRSPLLMPRAPKVRKPSEPKIPCTNNGCKGKTAAKHSGIVITKGTEVVGTFCSGYCVSIFSEDWQYREAGDEPEEW